MKKCMLPFILIAYSSLVVGQKLTLSETTKFYEYSNIKESPDTTLITRIKKRLIDLNYKEVKIEGNYLSAEGFTNHLVGGFATVEIRYSAKIVFKDSRYKMTLTNFVLTDVNGSNPLEGMGAFKKKWIKKINDKLPEIVNNLENLKSDDDW